MRKLFLFFFLIISSTTLAHPLPECVATEAKKNKIEILGEPAMTLELTLPAKFDGPDWGLKNILCQEGKYDLTPYAGKEITLIRYATPIKAAQAEWDLWTVVSEGSCICQYLAAGGNSDLTPGLMSVKSADRFLKSSIQK